MYRWKKQGNRSHLLPIEDSWGRGLHACKTLEFFLGGYAYLTWDVVGEVLLYGKIIEGEYGYQAERADISAFFDLTGKSNRFRKVDIRKLADNYGVPLIHVDEVRFNKWKEEQ